MSVYILLKVVSYYDLSVLSMSVMVSKKKVWMGGVGGWGELCPRFFFWNFFNFAKPLRHNTSQIQLIEGKMECRRFRGRPRNTRTTDITTTNGMKYYQLKRATEDRKICHGLVVNLAQETTL